MGQINCVLPVAADDICGCDERRMPCEPDVDGGEGNDGEGGVDNGMIGSGSLLR
jgi:hypothetical protein